MNRTKTEHNKKQNVDQITHNTMCSPEHDECNKLVTFELKNWKMSIDFLLDLH